MPRRDDASSRENACGRCFREETIVHGSDKEVRVEQIERWLSSGCEEMICRAVEQVDELYRERTMGLLRRWSWMYGSPITNEDLPEIWNDTLLCVFKSAMNHHYRRRGSLEAYLRCIATRRAIDRSRRMRCRSRMSPLTEETEPFGCDEDRMPDLIEQIEAAYDRLTARQRLVLECSIRFWVRNLSAPTLGGLTAEINDRRAKNGEEPLSEKAVQSALERAFRKLRDVLKEFYDRD
jgi:DNA-directed RNA polymerase specialized sigma24 family protein